MSFSVLRGFDSAAWKPFSLLRNNFGVSEAWGFYLKSGNPSILIQAPHPVADENTEDIALEIWRRVPGALLMIAGAHRQAGGPGGNQGLADVPWNAGSMFNKVSAHYMPLTQLQVHGFANSTAPDKDIVLASGSAPAKQLLSDLADALEDAGFRVGRVWEGYPELTAVGNKQSLNAKSANATFLHMELNRTIRLSPTLWGKVVNTVADVLNAPDTGYTKKGVNYGVGQLPVFKIETALDLLSQHFYDVRVTYPNFNSTSVPYWQDICLRAKSKGMDVTWGITCGASTSNMFNAFLSKFIELSAWAAEHGILLGVNEEMYHNNDSVISDSAVLSGLHAAASTAKANNPNVRLAISLAGDGELDKFIAGGSRGAFDIVGLNQYGTLAEHKANIDKLTNAYGANTMVTEFNNGRGFDPQFGNEASWKDSVKSRADYIQASLVNRFHIYTWADNTELTPSGTNKWNFRTTTYPNAEGWHEAFDLFL